MSLLKAARRESQRFLRFVLRWYFGFLFILFLYGTYWNALSTIHREYVSRPFLSQICEAAVPPVLAAVFGMAWWTVRQEKDSAKAWAIAACLTNLAISIGVPLRFYYLWGASAFWHMEYIFALPTAIGVAGLVVFLPPDKQPRASATAHRNSAGGRKPFAGIFGLATVQCLGAALYTIYRNHAVLPLHVQLDLALYLALALVFGAAWWTIWREKPSADAWGIAASLIFALMFLGETIDSWPSDLAHNLARNGHWLFKNVGGLFLGTAGLVLFFQDYRQHHSIKNTSEPAGQLTGKPAPLE